MLAQWTFSELTTTSRRPGSFVINELLKEGVVDWVDAATCTGVLVTYARIAAPAVGKRVAIRLLSAIVERGLMKGGTVTDAGFEEWPCQKVISVLQQQWPEDRWPRLGDLAVWFDLTDVGKRWLIERELIDAD